NVQTTLLRRYLFQLSLVVYSKHFLPFGILHLLSPFLYTSVHLQFVLVEFAYLSSFNLLYLTNHDWSVYNMFYLLFSCYVSTSFRTFSTVGSTNVTCHIFRFGIVSSFPFKLSYDFVIC